MSSIGLAPTLLAVLVTAALVYRGAPSLPFARFRWWLVPVQLALFAAFFAVTARLASDAVMPSRDARAWLAAWWTTGAASAGALILAAFRARALASALRRSWRVVAVMTAVGAAAWIAALAAERLWPALGAATLWTVVALLRLGGGDVVVDPGDMVVGLAGFEARIAPVCSGIQGIGLIVVLTAALLLARRSVLRFPAALLLLPLGAALAFAANAVRIALLIEVGARWSPGLAYGAFHSKAGWLLFCALAVGMAWLARGRPFAAQPAQSGPNPAAPYAMPLAASAFAALAGGALLPQPWTDALRLAATAAALWIWRPSLPWRPALSSGAFGVLAAALVWMLSPVHTTPGLALFVLVTPLAEELALRGYVFRRLVDADFESVQAGRFTWRALAASALVSGLLHPGFLAGAAAGLVYTAAQIRRGRVADAIAAHAVANALLAAAAM